MADKKITIKPSDMERLRELMRQEEEKLDAANPSDAELSQWENRLEDSVRDLAARTPAALPPLNDEMDRNWAALQQKLKQPAKTAADNPERSAEVLPMKRPAKNKALPWIGFAAAAALILIMARPGTQDDRGVMQDQNIQVKGTSGQVSAADCEVDVSSLNGTPVNPTANGQGFEGPAGTEVEVSVRCNQSGFLRAVFEGPENQTLTTPVTNGERQRILREGQIARISLQSGKPWSISLVLTDKELSKDAAVPDNHVLWQDKISVGARE